MSETITRGESVICHGIRTYGEQFPVEIMQDTATGRLILVATNEGGHNCTLVDLGDLLKWLQSEDAKPLRMALKLQEQPPSA